MKYRSNIVKTAQMLLASCCLVACNYLDIIPPGQADFEDTMKDEEATLSFLYGCYSAVTRSTPFHYHAFELSADEAVAPPAYSNWQQQVAWGTISASYTTSWGSHEWNNIWNASYNEIGYIHRFLDLIDVLEPVGVTAADKEEYKGECYFLEAYYHFRILQAFGPCPIITGTIDPNVATEDIPGRSHFDYCVDYIVSKLDDAASVLPATRPTNYLGRATSTASKALKARVLLYAASPLWNGSFPYSNWQNTHFETPGYGTELVSTTYDRSKWERALTACQEALTAATNAGYELFDISTANSKADRDGVDLPFIPGKEEDTPENTTFKERVRMFQYLATANEGDNNNELIWAQRLDIEANNGGENRDYRLPAKVTKRSNGVYMGGWSADAPTLYTVQHFYTENGKLPALDNDFYPESEWYTRFYEGTESPALATDDLDGEEVKNDIIKLHAGREARFYAWIVFDGSQYSPKINNGGPLWMNFKNTNTNGYNLDNVRNHAGTGYLSKKFMDPNMFFGSDGTRNHTATRRPLLRMAELYLNLAECYAALDNTTEALNNLNMIRSRAGLDNLTTSDLTGSMTLTDWVRNERFVELFEEGHRYYDLRRWTIAPEMLKAGARYGLNGFEINPTFEEFNKPTPINQPFRWDERLYLLPIWSSDDANELYSNPQMIQAPGY
ncbi:MAG: RagB/SusD family nutrient uptake outer membrane protein [Bacteroides sp.]|nr:RagB/SusD family nutrient uptake outer membrane protein [Bacteroides sp.]